MNNKELDKIFWDIDEKERGSLPVDFVIKRSLIYGGVFTLNYLFHNYEKEKIQNVFSRLKDSEISKKRYFFFKNYLFV